MGSLTNPFPVPVLRREGHFDVQSRTPSGIHIDHYEPSEMTLYRSKTFAYQPEVTSSRPEVTAK
jgi:Zn-dependent membrane protease YugP